MDVSTLQFGDNDTGMYSAEYRITECRCHFKRTYENCMPQADAQCEDITLTVVAPGKADLNLEEWFMNGLQMSGKITFAITGDMNSQNEFSQELMFENAYCTQLSESYDIAKSAQRMMTLTVVPMMVKVLDISFPRPDC